MTFRSEPTNFDRAAWAAEALATFRRRTGTDYEDALGDLLCDLMHWADEHELDFDSALSRARDHHHAEVQEAGEVHRMQAENAVIAALMQAVVALNTAPRFRVPSLDTDSYAIAAECDKAIATAKRGAA
jgi:hypothetical protein